MLLSSRRNFLTGLVFLIAAPAIVRASSLMPVRIVKSFNYQELASITRTAFVPRLFVQLYAPRSIFLDLE